MTHHIRYYTLRLIVPALVLGATATAQPPPPSLTWALIATTPETQTWFANIPDGHLVKLVYPQGVSVSFVPDPQGKWKPMGVTDIRQRPLLFDGRNLMVSSNGPWFGQNGIGTQSITQYVIPYDKILYMEPAATGSKNNTKIILTNGKEIDVYQGMLEIAKATQTYP